MATNSAFVDQVLALTNQFRAQNGLAALKANLELNAAAQGHSEDMANQDYFDHTGKNGSLPWDRAKVVGYEARTMGENIAAGQTTPESVVQGWINSPGHRANLLNANFTELGVGYFVRVQCLVVGARTGFSGCPQHICLVLKFLKCITKVLNACS